MTRDRRHEIVKSKAYACRTCYFWLKITRIGNGEMKSYDMKHYANYYTCQVKICSTFSTTINIYSDTLFVVISKREIREQIEIFPPALTKHYSQVVH